MTNAEHQRKFREEHPDYYRLLHAKRRAEAKAGATELAAIAAILAVKKQPLMLPAPVEVLILPGLKTIEALPVLAS